VESDGVDSALTPKKIEKSGLTPHLRWRGMPPPCPSAENSGGWAWVEVAGYLNG